MGKVKGMLLASEWSSKHGGLSTFNRELAIHLAKHPEVEVFFFLPKCQKAETEATTTTTTISFICMTITKYYSIAKAT